MPAWPASLPQRPDVSGYSEKPQSQVTRSEMDAGPAKSRRRFTAGTTDLAWAAVITGAQIATLESFYDSDIAAGALPFDMPHPRTGDTITVRMKSPYSLSALGGTRYKLEMTIEVLP